MYILLHKCYKALDVENLGRGFHKKKTFFCIEIDFENKTAVVK